MLESAGQILNTTLKNMESESHCSKCNEPLFIEKEFLGEVRKLPVICKCRKEELEKERERLEKIELESRLAKLKKNSLMDERFRECTFDNWIMEDSNKKLYQIGKKYCDNWKEVKKENIGLLLYGAPGTGKTFLSFCIANYLIERYVPVIAISSIGILSRIKETYNSYGKEGETEIIRTIKNADLLVLDDLGAENNTEWSKEKIYEIIDFRYRNKKPIIITTNSSLENLENKLTGSDGIARTYDRIIEMCTPLEIKGESRRVNQQSRKTKLLKEILN